MPTIKEERDKVKKRLCAWGSALSDCERRREEIKDLQKQLEEMDDVLRGQKIDDMPKGTNVGNPTAMALEVKERTANRIAQLLEEISAIMQRKEQMDAEIAALPEEYQRLLDMKYKRGHSLYVVIPRLLNISSRTATYWMEDIFERLRNIA